MGFFNRLRRKKEVQKRIFPTRGLNLKVPPIAENGHILSSHFVDAVREIEGIELAFEVDSLKYVDEFLENYSQQYDVDSFAETIFVAGCFAGEIMVQTAGGKWINGSDADLPEGARQTPIAIQLPNGVVCFPIAKAFKRFTKGKEDDLAYFYHVFTKIDREKTENA